MQKDDVIYRQAVLDLINADWKYEGLEIKINNLPPAEPRKRGKWINDCCSICGYGVEPWNNTPYCPNCGANMKGE